MSRFAHTMGLGLGLAAMLALGACREDEQGRVIDFDPGVYKGQADSPISNETRDDLRQRAGKMGAL